MHHRGRLRFTLCGLGSCLAVPLFGKLGSDGGYWHEEPALEPRAFWQEQTRMLGNGPEEGEEPELTEQELRKVMSKPIVKSYDMTQEMNMEAVEVITMAVDKFVASKNYEAAATLIKNTFDKKFGAYWHCAIGEGFGFDVTYQQKHLIYVFYGPIGVVCYKC